jgi:hypothetical protein
MVAFKHEFPADPIHLAAALLALVLGQTIHIFEGQIAEVLSGMPPRKWDGSGER